MSLTKLILPQSEGPYQIVEKYANGTIKIQCGGYRKIVSFTRITPFFMRN